MRWRAGAWVAAVLTGVALPGRAADGATIEVRIDTLRAGAVKVVRRDADHAFAIVRTTPAMLSDLRAQTLYTWSGRPVPEPGPAFFVFSLSNADDRCLVRHAPPGAPRFAPVRLWQGGFYDPCRFGEWDYAGRAIRQYEDQAEAMRRPDLQPLPFERRARSALRVTPQR